MSSCMVIDWLLSNVAQVPRSKRKTERNGEREDEMRDGTVTAQQWRSGLSLCVPILLDQLRLYTLKSFVVHGLVSGQ